MFDGDFRIWIVMLKSEIYEGDSVQTWGMLFCFHAPKKAPLGTRYIIVKRHWFLICCTLQIPAMSYREWTPIIVKRMVTLSLSASVKMLWLYWKQTVYWSFSNWAILLSVPLGGFPTSSLHRTATNTDRCNTKLRRWGHWVSTQLLPVEEWNLWVCQLYLM